MSQYNNFVIILVSSQECATTPEGMNNIIGTILFHDDERNFYLIQ